MKRPLFSAAFLLLVFLVQGQSVSQRLQKAFQRFAADSQLRYAGFSLYVVDAATGEVVFDKNSRLGLAPASTQKIITSVTALELLGKDFRYRTGFGAAIRDKKFSLYIQPSGDPTLGSWRWTATNTENVLKRIYNSLAKYGFQITGPVIINNKGWEGERIPDGWIWQDIGNYYGSGAGKLNWRENQYDLYLKSGAAIGDEVNVVRTDPPLFSYDIISQAKAADKGTGDNAYIYLPAGRQQAIVRGTIPVNENSFLISGAMTDPPGQFANTLVTAVDGFTKQALQPAPLLLTDTAGLQVKILHEEFSPSLDSIIYWFNKKSINLYGEALVKTMAYEKSGTAHTDSGTALVRRFWKEKGLDPEELNIYDGSGLSPLNRVTTHVQVEILKYAKSRDWFPAFFRSLPEYNGMTMKSGTISDVKGYCGYHKAKDGKEYIFSFLVNNYSGRSGTLNAKMFKVLDELK